MINSIYKELLDEVVQEIYEAYPDLINRYGEQGKKKCFEDNVHHMKHLETTYALGGNSQFFTDYALWLNGILVRHGMETRHLIDNFERIQRVVPKYISNPEREAFIHYLNEGIAILKNR
ncbi:hypothetical protein [Metabacillus iocasae]|uniref:Uncharacterized protein n=1 Tax=Priestia iocasae TaxID=2291674 RepID=A0ABS2QRU9_9BACI|nr:hypothetical protein [Metabacillus iocasae]MBM7702125.1 hypothetical protein [Metabacillus iocasae]